VLTQYDDDDDNGRSSVDRKLRIVFLKGDMCSRPTAALSFGFLAGPTIRLRLCASMGNWRAVDSPIGRNIYAVHLRGQPGLPRGKEVQGISSEQFRITLEPVEAIAKDRIKETYIAQETMYSFNIMKRDYIAFIWVYCHKN
jgi:hypothetical protein